MKIYTVHIKKGDENPLEGAVFVKEGFAFFAAIFQLLWTLYNKMWFYSLVVFAISLCFVVAEKYAIINVDVASFLKIGFLVYVGYSANDWYRNTIAKKGYIFFEIVSANNEMEAQQKFLNKYANKSLDNQEQEA